MTRSLVSRWRARLGVNPLILVALAVAIGWYIPSMLSLADTRAEALAYTDCPWRGPARVTITANVTRADSLPVLAHERVHAAQCRSLGPLRYRLRNLRARGRMSLEAPAYCAGATERVRLGQDRRYVSERLRDDALAAFAGTLDSAEVLGMLRAACAPLVASPSASD